MSARSIPLALLALSGCAAATAPDEPASTTVGGANRVATAPAAYPGTCKDWDGWDKPAEPFRVFGNTYYVGTCGISAILIVEEAGSALIDSGTAAGADVVLANIRKLGIDPGSVTVLLNSHEHFDHVGGMAKLQQATGAPVISSEIGIDVMSTGKAHRDDPQAGTHEPMAPVMKGMPYSWGDAPYKIDYFGLVPIETPGHTPGAMSWTWEACEGKVCRQIVYADSLSPVSADDYRFSDHPAYLAAYRRSLAAIAALDCDILLTPHPSASGMRDKLVAGDLASGMTCRDYAAATGKRLDDRLAQEAAGQ